MSGKTLLLVLGGAVAVAAFVFASGEARATTPNDFRKLAKPPFPCIVEENLPMDFVSVWNVLHTPYVGQPLATRDMWFAAAGQAEAQGFPSLAKCFINQAPPYPPDNPADHPPTL